ncbi:MAG: ATP-binding protein [Acidobacteriia bacterium]|nr:ATP-binding protein [Terriglobia bacterium]
MPSWTTITVPDLSGFLTFSGIRIRRILSTELFYELVGASSRFESGKTGLAAQCRVRWTDLADTLAALPEPAEMIAIFGSHPDTSKDTREVFVGFLSIGRGPSGAEAEKRCVEAQRNLWVLVETILDYAELEPIDKEDDLRTIVGFFRQSAVTEVQRRYETVRISQGVFVRESLGFETRKEEAPESGDQQYIEPQLAHLYPWVPSDDTWRRLLEALSKEPVPTALVVHLRGWQQAPEACRREASRALVVAEKIARYDVGTEGGTVPQLQADVLRHEALRRLSVLEGRVLAARVFISAGQAPSSALVGTVISCLDDASIRPGQSGAESMFRGGAKLLPARSSDILAPLDEPALNMLFGPCESSAFLRTPMPTDVELPSLPINRARTAAIVGYSGDDVPLGSNVHRGSRVPVTLDGPMRFRHTYIVGQTGTGKSTLLLHMILHDIDKGRGVAVLDPHGSLIDQVLLHYPAHRDNDLIIVDVTDIERPVGFNVLSIDEKDPLQYRLVRDRVIDDLFSFLERTYDMRRIGGPMFEMHFRGMLGLLLGLDVQKPPFIPNLLIFKLLYANKHLRSKLVERIRDKDLLLNDFVEEALAVSGETSLQNMAPYITSKFNRFISDLTLRNITCQNSMLDLDDIVNNGRVVLFYSGKGRFGDQAAGLLASQFISRLRWAVMKRGAQKNVRPFYLYADEFQLFADNRFTEMLAEARKFQLSLTLAHQYARQIPEEVLLGVLGNVGTTVIFRVGASDGAVFDPLFKPTFNERDLASLPNFRAYVRSFGSLGNTPFSVETEPPPSGGDPGRARTLRQQSSEKYGRPRIIVEQEIEATYKAYKKMDFDGTRVLEFEEEKTAAEK